MGVAVHCRVDDGKGKRRDQYVTRVLQRVPREPHGEPQEQFPDHGFEPSPEVALPRAPEGDPVVSPGDVFIVLRDETARPAQARSACVDLY